MNINKLKYIIGICKIYIGIIIVSILIAVASLIYLDDTWKSIAIGAVITIITTCIIEMRAKYERNLDKLNEKMQKLIILQQRIVNAILNSLDANGNKIKDGKVTFCNIKNTLNLLDEELRTFVNYPLLNDNDNARIVQLIDYVNETKLSLESILLNCNDTDLIKISFLEALKTLNDGLVVESISPQYLNNFYLKNFVNAIVYIKIGITLELLQEVILSFCNILGRYNREKYSEIINTLINDKVLLLRVETLGKTELP